MRSDFLEGEQREYASGGLGGLLGSLYGWSTLDMLAKFHETGEYTVPWSGIVKPGGFRTSAIGKKWGITPRANVQTVGTKDAMGRMLLGDKFIGMGKRGAAQLFASKAIGFGLSTMAWTDPVFFAFTHIANPAMWPVGIGWFGGAALWKNTARAMERTRYVDMNQIFPETQASFTSRQRAVRAISESHLQARSAIGNEAQLFHR